MSYSIEVKESEVTIKGKITLKDLLGLIKIYEKAGYTEAKWGDNTVIHIFKKGKHDYGED